MKKRTKVYYTPPAQVTLTYHKPMTAMTREEAQTWITGIRTRLLRKQERERAYLDRRAARGTHTPTDEAYEADQLLENDLVAILDDLLQGLTEEA
jgi:hypothetical protein